MFVNKYGKYYKDKPREISIDLTRLSLDQVLNTYDNMWIVHPDYKPEYDFTRREINIVKTMYDQFQNNSTINLPQDVKIIFEDCGVIGRNYTEVSHSDVRVNISKLLIKKKPVEKSTKQNIKTDSDSQLSLF